MGHEDRDVLAPAVARLRAEGIDIRGPLPPTRCSMPARGRPTTSPSPRPTIRR